MTTTNAMHRVARQSSPRANQQIRRQTEMRLSYYRENPKQISQRLRELEQESSIERVLGMNSSILSLVGLVLGLRKSRWLLLPVVVQSFFLQHQIQGWCPPLEIFRRMGYREQAEIDEEYNALKGMQTGRE